MTNYKKIENNTPVTEFIVERITNNLHAGKQVLWLICGGSAEAIAIAVSKQLYGKDLRLLTVSLTDERYGAVGHTDSNWQQLVDGGFDVPGAALVPVLIAGLDDCTLTAEKFNDNLRGLLSQADYKLGLFGIGSDGHTAGILPHSPAVTAAGYATCYEGPDYQRITMTPHAISKLDEAVVYAVGQPKWPVIDNFDVDAILDDQPAQALKHVPLLTICNDRKGDTV
jgi:6-phosphogluconolactonase/glucosamine-6-phosphate isomerase/deaminase